ncbi:MAG: hypothetical protein AAFY56_12510 [Pseudomonadota bacterium]
MRRLVFLTLSTVFVLSTLMAVSQPIATRSTPNAKFEVGVPASMDPTETHLAWRGSFSKTENEGHRYRN